MRIHSFLIIPILLLTFLVNLRGQVFTSAPDFQLEYWRSFDGIIRQTVNVDNKGQFWLNTTLERGMTEEDRKQNSSHTTQQIRETDFKPLLDLFNSYDARVYFSETKRKEMLDGSSMRITLNQNLFAMTFWCQSPFEKNAPPFNAKLAAEALRLFKLAKLDLEKESLY